MLKHLSVLSAMLLSAVLGDSLEAAELDVKSTVSKVVLFQSAAEISRNARVQLSHGRTSVIFSGIPQNLNPDSLRVSGSGSAQFSILGVEQRIRFLTQDVSAQAAELGRKIKSLERELSGIEMQKARIDSQQAMLQTVQLDKPIPSELKDILRPRNSQEMAQLLTFVAEASAKLDDQRKMVNEKDQDLNEQLEKLNSELSLMHAAGKQESIVEVALDTTKTGDAELALTYQMQSAGWSPSYNFNYSSTSNEPSFALETYALARQSTGEDWNDIELTLSTAQTQRGLNRPVISPLSLDLLSTPIMPMVAAAPLGRGKLSAAADYMLDAVGEQLRGDEDLALALPQSEAAVNQAQEQVAQVANIGVVSFTLPSKVSIKSDGSIEKVKLSVAALKGTLRNIVIPSRTNLVYREAKLENTMDVPLLPGQITIFADGNYVGKQSVGLTPQNKELLLSVGVSDQISVERKQIKKYEDDSGLVRSIRRISTAYEIEVENHGKQNAEIVVLEPTPLSRNEKISVSLANVTPIAMGAKDVKRLQKGEGILEWQFSMSSKKKEKLAYESVVEFASDVQVVGLESI